MNERITPLQFFWLFVNSRLVLTIVFNPALDVVPKDEHNWIADAASWLFTVVIALIWLRLWKRHPDKSLIQMLITITGPVIGRAIGLLYIWYLFQIAALTIRSVSDFVVTSFLAYTPIIVVLGSMALVVAAAVRQGIESIGRIAELTVPFMLLCILTIVLFAVPEMNFSNVKPTFENALLPILKGSFATSSRWTDLLWAAMIIPHFAPKGKLPRTLIGAITVTVVGFVLIGGGEQAVFGPEIARRLLFPFLMLTRYISIGEFFERLDALFLFIWVMGAFVRAAIFAYACILSVAHWTGVKEYRYLITPGVLLLLPISIWIFEDLIQIRAFGKAAMVVELLFTVVIPLGLVGVDALRNRHDSQKHESLTMT